MKNGIANTFVFIVDLHDYMNIYILKVEICGKKMDIGVWTELYTFGNDYSKT